MSRGVSGYLDPAETAGFALFDKRSALTARLTVKLPGGGLLAD